VSAVRQVFYVALLMMSWAASVAAEQDSMRARSFQALVQRFAGGEVAQVALELSSWPERGERAAVESLIKRQVSLKTLESAAMLETDLAFRVGQGDDALKRANAHLQSAHSLIDSLGRRGSESPQAQPFQRRWYLVVGTRFITLNELEYARTYIASGLRAFPSDAPLLLASGMIDEASAMTGAGMMRARHAATRRRDPVLVDHEAEFRTARAIVLSTAEAEYRRALEFEPALNEARLRLGRVLSVRGDRTGAQNELDRALAGAPDRRAQYLAHLFLGRVAADAGDLRTAQTEYEAAQTTFPGCQTPDVALAELADRRGLAETADRYLGPMKQSERPDGRQQVEDPWWSYLFGGGGRLESSARWLQEAIKP
jgi:tetratricopeptide (TPR) repeat protein